MSASEGDPAQAADDCLPLAGVRVLDFTQVIAGPYCTTMLADLGAEVVKVESPGRGDELRYVGRYPGREAHEDYFHAVNHGKKSLILDLKNPAERAVAHALARRADIAVENFAPGTAARLGIAWSDLKAVNPRLLYCSISGFGQEGPYRDRLAVDPIIQAVTGIMSVTGAPGGGPMQMGAPLGDVIAGMFAAYAIVGVLHQVRADGRGRSIDMSMQAALLSALAPRMGGALNANLAPGQIGNQNPMRTPSDVYPTRDGGHVFLMVHNDRVWAPFCRAVGRSEWIEDPRYASNRLRCEHREALNREVGAIFAASDLADISERLRAERVPYSVVNDYVGAVTDPQVEQRAQVRTITQRDSGEIRVVGPPWLIDGRAPPIGTPPSLDEHADTVLRDWLGWDEARIAAFHGARGRAD